jgi:hypothetical protein
MISQDVKIKQPIRTYENIYDIVNKKVVVNYFKLDNDDNINKLWKLFSLYNGKRSTENYNRSQFDFLIHENRFSYGVIELSIDGETILYSGFSEYENWIVVTRYVVLKFSSIPFSSAYMIPYIIEKCKQDHKDGVVYTFNHHMRLFQDFCNQNRIISQSNFSYEEKKKIRYSILRKHPDLINHELFNKSYETDKLYNIIDHPVWYKYTKQWVVYIPLNNTIPKFQKYEE